MRIAVCLLTLSTLVLGVTALARGDEDATAKLTVEDRVRVLEYQVDYLRSREAALTAYILQNEQRAKGIEKVVEESRRAGFTGAAFSSRSRELLLDGMAQLGKSLQEGLPVTHDEEKSMLRQMEFFKKLRAKAAAPDGE